MDNTQRADSPCSLFPTLDDSDLIAAIDGEAEEWVRAHLRSCPACAARAREFDQMQRMLRARLYRSLCPSSDDLAAFQQGVLEGGRRLVVADHVAECPCCTHELRLSSGMFGGFFSALAIPLRMPHR